MTMMMRVTTPPTDTTVATAAVSLGEVRWQDLAEPGVVVTPKGRASSAGHFGALPLEGKGRVATSTVVTAAAAAAAEVQVAVGTMAALTAAAAAAAVLERLGRSEGPLRMCTIS